MVVGVVVVEFVIVTEVVIANIMTIMTIIQLLSNPDGKLMTVMVFTTLLSFNL